MKKISMEQLFWKDNVYCNSSSISSLYTAIQDADNSERFQERAKIVSSRFGKKKNLRQIKSDEYLFLLIKGLRVKFYPGRIITYEKTT